MKKLKNILLAVFAFALVFMPISLVGCGTTPEEPTLVYGEYYVGDQAVEGIGGQAYIVIKIDEDNQLDFFMAEEKPNADTIDTFLETALGMTDIAYTTSVEGDVMTMTADVGSIEYNTETGVLSMYYPEQDLTIIFELVA